MVATGGGVVLLRVRHPPAGATALLVSLGFLTTAAELAAIMVGVLLLTVLGWVVNRAFGLDVPIWSAAED
jgi:CBS domain-containing membrane protein